MSKRKDELRCAAGKLTLSFRTLRYINSAPVIYRKHSYYLDFRSPLLLKFILIALVLLLPALPAFAADINVDATCTLAQAINEANELTGATNVGSCEAGSNVVSGSSGADTIILSANVTLTADLPAITTNITIDGKTFTIDGGNSHRAFNFTAGVTAEIKDVTLTQMQAQAESGGGAINVRPASGTVTLTLNNVTVQNSSAWFSSSQEEGGGLACTRGALTINNSVFSNNRGNSGGAIAIRASCTATISRSAIHGNTARTDGGGIHVIGSGTIVTVDNSSIYGNSTGSEDHGGGVYIGNAGTITLNHVTITDNSSPGAAGNRGGGIAVRGGAGHVVVRNSIVYGNSNGDCAQTNTLTINTGNIFGELNNCGAGTNGVSGDPLLADSATGSPPYYAIPFNSPAVDAVDCLSSSTTGYNIDQRGQARPVGAKCDIGAFEVYIINLVSGTCSLPDAITAANTDTATNGCPAGKGDDTIALDDDVTLAADLPVVTSNIGFKGNGYSIDGVNAHRAFDFTDGGITVVLQDLTLTRNRAPSNSSGTATDSGGAIAATPVRGGTLTLILNKVTISSTSAWYEESSPRAGGAMAVSFTDLTINDSVFDGNRGSTGGAIQIAGSVMATINRSVFRNNAARSQGGAIRIFSGTLTINNSTFYNNSSENTIAARPGAGGAIEVDDGGTLNLNQVTIANNTVKNAASNRGGGLANIMETSTTIVRVRNSIIFGNTPEDCFQQITLAVNTGNLIGTGNCGPGTNGVDGDPLLSVSPGSRYVGLAPESPAIDAVDCLAETFPGYNEDQRGHARPYGERCDVGAIEVSPTNVEGDCTLPDAITAASTDTATGGCPAGAGHDVIVLPENNPVTLTDTLPDIEGKITLKCNGNTISASGVTFGIFYLLIEAQESPIADLTIEDCIVEGGACATCSGGAFHGKAGTKLTILRSVVRNSSAGAGNAMHSGGAIYMEGNTAGPSTLSLRDSSIHNNSATSAGGGIHVTGMVAVDIQRSAVYSNTAGAQGGGVNLAGAAAEAIINNSSIFGNTSGSGEYGGGINIGDGALVRLNHVTVTGNIAQGSESNHGGGIASRHADNRLHARNSIVYGNTLGDCVQTAALLTDTANFFGAGNCHSETAGDESPDLPDLDPLLPESASGSPPYFALPAASPAIDFTRCLEAEAGGNEDQRGSPRPWPADYLCDAGAYEYIADFIVDENCSFKDAWTAAWTDTATGGCPAGDGDDIIHLTGDVTLGETIFQGGDGMGTLTIEGNGYAFRGDGTYRFFGLWGAPTITFNNIAFTGAAEDGANGAAFNPYGGAGTYTFNDCVFHNNSVTYTTTAGNGGAISAGSDTTITINRCAFYNNRAETGGAIHTAGTLTISNSSFYNNQAVREGGAITATHTDISKPVTIRHVTMINNRGGTDSGALQLAQTNVAHVRNSILYGNTPRDCYIHGKTSPVGVVGKQPNEQGNPSSFIGVSNCDFELRNYGDQRNPQLAGPFNGYYIPRPGSPAIDFVDCLPANQGGNRDQRRRPRPLGENCDAGAIEDAGYVPPPSPESDDDEDEDEDAEAAASVGEIRDCPAPPGSPRRFGHIGSGDWQGNFARLGIQARNAAKQAEWAAGAASVSGMNRCLWDLECSTDGHWAYGHYLATHGHSYGAPGSQPPAAFGRAGGKYNLCYSVWNCNSAEAWDFGFESGKQIYDGFLIERGVPQC